MKCRLCRRITKTVLFWPPAIFLVATSNPAAAQGSSTTAFQHVNVIPMDSERVLENQTVIVEGDRITAIGPADDIAVPEGTEIIEGGGAHLIPGLADMHAHIDGNPDFLTLYLANGVTTIRNFNAVQEELEMARRIEAGHLLGPSMYNGPMIGGVPPSMMWMVHLYRFLAVAMVGLLLYGLAWAVLILGSRRGQARKMRKTFLPYAGILVLGSIIGSWSGLISAEPLITTLAGDTNTLSPSRAGRIVKKHHEAGYDFIKTQWFLTRETFDAIVAAAAKVGVPVAGHTPAEVGVEHFIESGVEPQHDYQVYAFVAKNYERRPGANNLDVFDLSEADERLPKLAALMVESGVGFTPTMVVNEYADHFFKHLDDLPNAPLFQQPEYRYIPPEYMEDWTNSAKGELQVVMRARGVSDIREIIPDPAQREAILAYSKRQTKTLHASGVPILAGTDPSVLGNAWGFSLHRELELLVEAGLTPYEALAAATRVPAEFMDDGAEWGTIEVGKRADMVLLKENPLENISHTRDRLGVMIRGVWYPRAKLQQTLEDLAASYHDDDSATRSR